MLSSKALQWLPLLLAIMALELVFRFGLPYVWIDGLHWWPGIDNFWAARNQIDIMQQISINAILAFGMTLTILISGIDLSVGAVLALVGTTAVSFLFESNQPNSWPLLYGLLAALGAALAIGLFNGLCAAKTKMPPFIITLGMMMIARGAAYRFNEAKPMSVPREETWFLAIGNTRVNLLPPFLADPLGRWAQGGSDFAQGVLEYSQVPLPVLIMLGVFLLSAFLLHRTRFGQHIYAMGGNREAARFTGIPLVRVEVCVYMICSLLAGTAGLINTSQLYCAEPHSGIGFELNAIAAAVVGGTSFTGGKGTMVGTLLGAIIIGILDKGLNQAGVHFSYQYMVKGAVILSAVYLDVRRRK